MECLCRRTWRLICLRSGRCDWPNSWWNSLLRVIGHRTNAASVLIDSGIRQMTLAFALPALLCSPSPYGIFSGGLAGLRDGFWKEVMGRGGGESSIGWKFLSWSLGLSLSLSLFPVVSVSRSLFLYVCMYVYLYIYIYVVVCIYEWVRM